MRSYPLPGPAPRGRGYPGRMSTDNPSGAGPSAAGPSAEDPSAASPSAGDPGVAGLCAEIERRLREAGTPARAVGAKAYLKSSMEFAGVTLPVIRRMVSDVTRGRSLSGKDVRGLAEELWNRPLFECRVVALLLLTKHAGELRAGDAALVERLIREAGTWALVDDLAGKVMGSLVERYSELGATLDRWADDDDFWIRRSALLALLGPLRRGEGDFDRFGRYADSMLAEREFFIRKAIGWVLRDTARRRPELVADWLAPRAARASGVTMREAVKPLPPETARVLMAAYAAGRKRPPGAAR
jgi:3-methyladenine DNA glycosylase AlkD